MKIWVGETDWVAADDLAGVRAVIAETYDDAECYGEDEDWRAMADDELLVINDCHGPETKTVGDWLAGIDKPMVVCSTEY